MSLYMDDPGPGLPVPEFRDPVKVSDFASDIDPGPGDSSWRAGSTLSWPACIGFLAPELGECMRQSGWLPREIDFPADLFLRVYTPLLCYSGMDGRRYMCITAEMCMKFFLQRWRGRMYSDTSVTGVVLDVTAHWPGLACRPDFLKSARSSGRSLALLFEPNRCYGNPGRLDNPFREVLAETGRHGNFAVNVGLC